jgi:uncharacterized membrane protein YvbJ
MCYTGLSYGVTTIKKRTKKLILFVHLTHHRNARSTISATIKKTTPNIRKTKDMTRKATANGSFIPVTYTTPLKYNNKNYNRP